MAKKTNNLPFDSWAAAVEAAAIDIKTAWDDMRHRKLASVKMGQAEISPWAMRRANGDVQRRLAAHLCGYLLTENSFIVRSAGKRPGSPTILNTRITVEHIASFFNEGAGVADIQRDLPQLTREEIEAAIQYFLNHRDNIDADIQRSRGIFEANTSRHEIASL